MAEVDDHILPAFLRPRVAGRTLPALPCPRASWHTCVGLLHPCVAGRTLPALPCPRASWHTCVGLLHPCVAEHTLPALLGTSVAGLSLPVRKVSCSVVGFLRKTHDSSRNSVFGGTRFALRNKDHMSP